MDRGDWDVAHRWEEGMTISPWMRNRKPGQKAVSLKVRMGPELHKRLVAAARGDKRSINAEVLVALEEWLTMRKGSITEM
jgi:hypothetical protein